MHVISHARRTGLVALGALVLLCGGRGRADGPAPGLHLPAGRTTGLTHMLRDGGGFQWDIQHGGELGHGTNYLCGPGVRCMVNGSHVRGPRNQARLSRLGDELEIGPYETGGVRCWRRVKVYKDRPLARWVEIFENPGGEPRDIRVQLYTQFNHGAVGMTTSAGRPAFGPEDWAFTVDTMRHGPPGWQGGPPDFLQIVCGPEAEVRPTVRAGGNSVYVEYRLTVPAGGTAAVCHFAAQHRQGSQAKELFKGFDARALLGDLPAALRGAIVNLALGLGMAGVDLVRLDWTDVASLRNGDRICGRVSNAAFQVETYLGPVRLPAERVVGMALEDAPGGGLRAAVVLTDGQVVFGRPAGALELRRSGGMLRIALDRLRQWSFRVSPGRPERLAVAKAYAVLRTGDRLLFDAAGVELPFRTRCGPVLLRPDELLRVEMDGAEHAAHRARFRNGSTLAGFLGPETVPLPLDLYEDVAELPRSLLAALEFPAEKQKQELLTEVRLNNGDVLRGQIEEAALQLDSLYGTLKLDVRTVRRIAWERETVVAAVQAWDGSTLRGRLSPQTIRFRLVPGPLVRVPLGHVRQVVRRHALPPGERIERLRALVPRLGAESYADREKATEELLRLGPGILPLLRKYLDTPDAEIHRRLEQVIEKLEERSGQAEPAAVPADVMNEKVIFLGG